VEGDGNLKKFITNYYKGLFGEPAGNNVFVVESIKHEIPQVSQLENEFLTNDFLENEVKEAIFQKEHNEACEPDGFMVEFYQVLLGIN
jgi:hypothetical protein